MTSIRHLLLLGMLSLFIRPCAAGVTSDEWQTVAPSVVGLDRTCSKLWWERFDTVNSATAAFGNGGQRIWLVPSANLVAVVSAGLYNDPNSREILRRLLNDYMLPAIH